MDVTGDRSKVQCLKEQYCIGTWNVKSMNQGKLEVVKQEMARVNVDILGISELKWTGMGEFNSEDHYIYYCRQESLRINGVATMVNKRVRNAVLGCNLKNNRMISVHFQGKPFNITVIQVYAPTSNAEEAEVERFYEDTQDLLELTPKKELLYSRVLLKYNKGQRKLLTRTSEGGRRVPTSLVFAKELYTLLIAKSSIPY